MKKQKYTMPKRKLNLITKEFLIDFREELINEYTKNRTKNVEIYENATFIEWIMMSECSGTVYAFEKVCKKHNLYKALFKYWSKIDEFIINIYVIDDIILKMYNEGIIEYGDWDEYFDEHLEDYSDEIIKYNIVNVKNGYNVVEKDWEFIEEGESIEDTKSRICNLYNNDTRFVRFID